MQRHPLPSWAARADEHLVPRRGVGRHVGGVRQPALLNCQGQEWHSIDVAAHVYFVSNSSLGTWFAVMNGTLHEI